MRVGAGASGQRLPLYVATPAVGAQSLTGTWQSGSFSNAYAVFVLNIASAATEVGDTLDVYVDTAVGAPTSGGTVIATNVIHFAQVLGNGGAKQYSAVVNPGGSGAVRHILGDQWRYRIVQVDANSNAAFAISLVGYLF
jgi:hypothetical protein